MKRHQQLSLCIYWRTIDKVLAELEGVTTGKLFRRENGFKLNVVGKF
jgi:hypothetical protein